MERVAACEGIGFFFEGGVRVFASGVRGRQITLYEIVPGEVAFGSVERRLEDYLVERAEDGRVRLGRAELVLPDPAGD